MFVHKHIIRKYNVYMAKCFFVSFTSELSVVLFLKEGKMWERVLEEVLLNLLHMAKRVIK